LSLSEDQKTDVALYRFSLLAPILNNQVDDVKAYLDEVASTMYDVPHYGWRQYSARTVRRWLWEYRRDGLDALKPQRRKDSGSFRSIPQPLQDKILAARRESPLATVTLFYEELLRSGVLLRADASYYSVYRLLRKHGLVRVPDAPASARERKKFAFEQVNRLWQGDMMVGPYILVDGRRKSSSLFAFIDDCSRLVPFGRFDVDQDFDALKRVYIEAVVRRGIPQTVYLDNAKVYRSKLFHEALARMGTIIAHTQPYDAASKGKIERFFKTVRERFLPTIGEPSSIDDLNQAFWRWLEEDYHRRVHSSLGMSPLDKYLSQVNSVKLVSDPDAVRKLFLKREARRVNKDSTISVMGTFFEVPSELVGQRIEARFDPNDLERVFLYREDEFLGTATPVRIADNALVKRNKTSPLADMPLLSFWEALKRKEGAGDV
jgi:transposase InsO family protein